jgi:glycosyltransferase involved in cell wall biosynthesis
VVSLLNQTYEDFELIISDNASSDRTEEICRSYASKDKRIKYFRSDTNRGAMTNYDRVLELSSGEYFKWAAHDDVVADTFLEKAVSVLDKDPTVVLCLSKVKFIDEHGAILDQYNRRSRGLSIRAHERFCDLVISTHIVTELFGLTRASVLKRMPLQGRYVGSDRVLLGQLALMGQFYEIPEYLFFHREHSQTASNVHRDPRSYDVWYAPERANKRIRFPNWNLLRHHLRSIRNAPLSRRERGLCYLGMVRWLRAFWRRLIDDVLVVMKQSRGYFRRKTVPARGRD